MSGNELEYINVERVADSLKFNWDATKPYVGPKHRAQTTEEMEQELQRYTYVNGAVFRDWRAHAQRNNLDAEDIKEQNPFVPSQYADAPIGRSRSPAFRKWWTLRRKLDIHRKNPWLGYVQRELYLAEQSRRNIYGDHKVLKLKPAKQPKFKTFEFKSLKETAKNAAGGDASRPFKTPRKLVKLEKFGDWKARKERESRILKNIENIQKQLPQGYCIKKC